MKKLFDKFICKIWFLVFSKQKTSDNYNHMSLESQSYFKWLKYCWFSIWPGSLAYETNINISLNLHKIIETLRIMSPDKQMHDVKLMPSQ